MKYKPGFLHYAGETQIYGPCNNDGTKKLQMEISECVDESAAWMGASCLKLNSHLVFSSQNLQNISSYSVCVIESNILPSRSVRNLGISMKRDLTMSMQISNTMQTCFTFESKKFHHGMFDNRVLKNTFINFSVKSMAICFQLVYQR